MNLESVGTLEDRNRKRPNLRIKTDQHYHVFNYNNAISSQIHNFGWDKTRLFKPVTKDTFNFELQIKRNPFIVVCGFWLKKTTVEPHFHSSC